MFSLSSRSVLFLLGAKMAFRLRADLLFAAVVLVQTEAETGGDRLTAPQTSDVSSLSSFLVCICLLASSLLAFSREVQMRGPHNGENSSVEPSIGLARLTRRRAKNDIVRPSSLCEFLDATDSLRIGRTKCR